MELAHGAVGIISLNEDFGSDGCLLPHVLQAVSLRKKEQEITIVQDHINMIQSGLWSLLISKYTELDLFIVTLSMYIQVQAS